MALKTLLGLGLSLFLTSQASAGRLVFEEEFVVEGEVQKPEITVVISRENLNKRFILDLKESFLDKIIESVKNPPF